jgi:uncharacterized protein (TIGR02594 family)
MKNYPWFAIAKAKFGIHEIPGRKANTFIVECLESTTLGKPDNQTDETPWCSAFANRVMQLAGIEGTNSAWARSWLDWGREPTDDEFGKGVVVVLSRGATSGHVGFLVDWEYSQVDGDKVKLLGGNQGNAVSEAWFSMDRVLGYRVPA